jgi:pimeloyl-ACP methyl ester carboxylesterase
MPLAGVSQRFLTVGGLRLGYFVAGEPVRGELVLLHGSGLTGRTWTSLIGLLEPDFRCTAPDLRGHGDSDWAPDGSYGLRDQAADIVGLLDRIGVRRPVLVGMSMGGLVALTMMVGGFDAEALVLVDSGPRLRRSTGAPAEFLRRHSYPTLDSAVAAALDFNPRRSAELLRTSLAQNMVRTPDGGWRWKWDPRRLDGDRAAEADALWSRLDRIRSPTLVVRGADSAVFSRDDAETLRAALPSGTLVTIPDAGHTVQGDNPLGLADAIRSWLEGG